MTINEQKHENIIKLLFQRTRELGKMVYLDFPYLNDYVSAFGLDKVGDSLILNSPCYDSVLDVIETYIKIVKLDSKSPYESVYYYALGKSQRSQLSYIVNYRSLPLKFIPLPRYDESEEYKNKMEDILAKRAEISDYTKWREFEN